MFNSYLCGAGCRYLSVQDELALLAWILLSYRARFPATEDNIRHRAVLIMRLRGHEPRSDMHGWWADFQHRHREFLKIFPCGPALQLNWLPWTLLCCKTSTTNYTSWWRSTA